MQFPITFILITALITHLPSLHKMYVRVDEFTVIILREHLPLFL